MDFSGALNGTLSAGAASCGAELSGIVPEGPFSVNIAAMNNTVKSSTFWYFYLGTYTITAQICIWNQSDPAHRKCSPRYIDHSRSVTQG
jgi:hypothetical protein